MLRRGLPLLTFSLLPQLALAAAPTSGPTTRPAPSELQRAEADYDAAVRAAREAFRQSDQYRSAEQKIRQAESSLDSARADTDATPDAITAAATDSLDSRALLQRMESRAIATDAKVIEARIRLDALRTGTVATTQATTAPSDRPEGSGPER